MTDPLPARTLHFLAAAIALFVLIQAPAAARQYDAPDRKGAAPASAEETPSVESILQAHRSGKPASEIVAWIEESGQEFFLTFDELLKLHGEGVPIEVLAAMARVPGDKISDLLPAGKYAYTPPVEPRTGLSKGEIKKMIDAKTPEPDILKAIGENGSKASLSLDEAMKLREKGASATLLAAIVTGSVTPSAAQAAPQGAPPPPGAPSAVPTAAGPTPAPTGAPAGPVPAPTGAAAAGEAAAAAGGEDETPLLDGLLEEDEEPAGEVMEEETVGEEEAPSLDELAAAGEAAKTLEASARVIVLSDPPGAKIYVARSSTRMPDLLSQARPEGRTPAKLSLPPGSYFVLVEKKPSDFDAGLIPALRTVHDGDGRTRTLLVSGEIYYDVNRCCLPRSLGASVAISRISENQEGNILGDEFEGLPPYIWDGNRLLILALRDGRVDRVIKVYHVRKTATEARTLVATFRPSSEDPLAGEPRVLANKTEVEAQSLWAPPLPADLMGIARIYGIPDQDAAKISQRLAYTGKTLWKGTTADGTLIMLAISLDAHGRVRTDEVRLRKDGPFGMFSAPAPPPPAPAKKGKKAPPPPPPPPALAIPVRTIEPTIDLPTLSVLNATKSALLLRLSDGTVIYVLPGETRETTIAPGTYDLEARFEDRTIEKKTGRARFTRSARYALKIG